MTRPMADAATGLRKLHFDGLADGVFVLETALAVATKVVDLEVTAIGDQSSDKTQAAESAGGNVPLPPGKSKLGGVGEDRDRSDTGTETRLVGDAVIEEGGGNRELPINGLAAGVTNGRLDVLLVHNLGGKRGEAPDEDGVKLDVRDGVSLFRVRDPRIATVMGANILVGSVMLVLLSSALCLGQCSVALLFGATARSTYFFVVALLAITIAVIISKQRLTELLLPILPMLIFKVVHTSQGERVNPLAPNDADGIPRYDPAAKDDAIQPPEVALVGRSPDGVGGRMLEGGDELLNEPGVIADVLERVVGIGIRQRRDVLKGRPLVIREGVVGAEALRIVLRIGRVVGDVVAPGRQIQRQHDADAKDGGQHRNAEADGMEAEEDDGVEVDPEQGAIEAAPTSARARDAPEHRIVRQGQGPGNPTGEGIAPPLERRQDAARAVLPLALAIILAIFAAQKRIVIVFDIAGSADVGYAAVINSLAASLLPTAGAAVENGRCRDGVAILAPSVLDLAGDGAGIGVTRLPCVGHRRRRGVRPPFRFDALIAAGLDDGRSAAASLGGIGLLLGPGQPPGEAVASGRRAGAAVRVLPLGLGPGLLGPPGLLPTAATPTEQPSAGQPLHEAPPEPPSLPSRLAHVGGRRPTLPGLRVVDGVGVAGRAARGDADVPPLDGQAEEEEGEQTHHYPAGAGEPDCTLYIVA